MRYCSVREFTPVLKTRRQEFGLKSDHSLGSGNYVDDRIEGGPATGGPIGMRIKDEWSVSIYRPDSRNGSKGWEERARSGAAGMRCGVWMLKEDEGGGGRETDREGGGRCEGIIKERKRREERKWKKEKKKKKRREGCRNVMRGWRGKKEEFKWENIRTEGG